MIHVPANDPHSLDRLFEIEGRAELVGERIVEIRDGEWEAFIAGQTFRSLAEYRDNVKKGRAYSGKIVFSVPQLPSKRRTFSPDASFMVENRPKGNKREIDGPPDFAVEVRSPSDTERDIKTKRADYFQAGTKMVWDVNPDKGTIDAYSADAHDTPVRFQRGGEAHAEPLLPGWKVSVDWMLNEPDY